MLPQNINDLRAFKTDCHCDCHLQRARRGKGGAVDGWIRTSLIKIAAIILLLNALWAAAQPLSGKRPNKHPAGRGISSDPNKIPLSEAEKRIQAHLDFIQSHSETMSATFYYSGAAATLLDAFKDGSVQDSLQYADSWGKMGIGLTWSESAKEFYAYHVKALNDSLRIIRSQGFAKRSDLAYLDGGMRRWKQYEQHFPELFQELVEQYTQNALVLDEKSEYLKDYQAQLDHLSAIKPYPSAQIDSLNTEMYRKNKTFDARNKQMEQAEERTKKIIQDHAGTHVFSAIDEGLVTSTIE